MSSQVDAEFRSRLDARFRRPLMQFFQRRVHDAAEAEDLTQEVFLRLLNASAQQPIDNPEAFLFRIAHNLLHDRARREMRRRVHGSLPVDASTIDELMRDYVEDRSPDRVLMGKESLAEVLATLDELGERTRNIFILFRLEKMKQRDIAALYGIGQSTVEKHVMKAMLHLLTRFGPTGL